MSQQFGMPLSAVAARKLAQQKREAAQHAEVIASTSSVHEIPLQAITTKQRQDASKKEPIAPESSRKRKRKTARAPIRQESQESDQSETITTHGTETRTSMSKGIQKIYENVPPTTTDQIMTRVRDLGESAPPADDRLPPDHLEFIPSDESELEVDEAKGLPRYISLPLSNVRREAVHYQTIYGIRSAIVSLKRAETVIAVGQYDLWVRKGSVAICGAVLHASSKAHRVHAPSSHALPVINAVQHPYGGNATAEICLMSCDSSIRLLKSLHPSFAKLWNGPSLPDDHNSFRILWSSDEDCSGRPLQPLVESSPWKTLAASLTDMESSKAPVILVCGPKGTGKSTFTRFLTNAFLCSQKYDCVAYLDIDPGQPEYTPPGDVSLCLLKEHNFGPSYCHPNCVEGRDTVARAHHFGFITPRDDPDHYRECVMDLYRTYKRSYARHPLIVNCSGWIQGSGVESLESLVAGIRPTDTIYTSVDGPEEVLEALQRATQAKRGRLHTLSSMTPSPGIRTSSDLRSMLTMSYIHARALDSERTQFHWSSIPIQEMQHLSWSYVGEKPFIDAITLYTDFIQPAYLEYVIEMSLLAVVAVYNSDAFKQEIELETEYRDAEPVQEENTWHEFDLSSTATNSRTSEHETPVSLEQSHLRAFRRTKEGLPYYFPGTGAYVPFDPANSETLGQVLVRGLDQENGCLSVVTPVSEQLMEEHRERGAAIVLVKGKLDKPNWAHLEPYHAGLWRQQEHEKWKKRFDEVGGKDSVAEYDDHMIFDVESWVERTPWVNFVRDEDWEWRRKQKVWKVRRNLETSDARR